VQTTTANTTNTALRPRTGRQRSAHLVRPDGLPRALFVAEVLARGLTHVARDSFRGSPAAATLAEVSTPVLVRSDANTDEVEAFVRVPTGETALIDSGYGHVRIEAAATKDADARRVVAALRAAFETAPSTPDRIPIGFWMRGDCGGDVRHREIEAPTFDEIAGNYSASVRGALRRLIVMRAPDGGRLILWRGEPGTGKSHALRALARAWGSWCSAHFIMDPDELLGRGGAYMLDVLTWQDGGDDRWRVLILEDAGELIAADARAAAGQALSRLLNVADGLIGQGMRTVVLITTNEPVKRLHPAARRPGRCLADIEFTALSPVEANRWLAARGRRERVERPTTLAELFGRTSGDPPVSDGPIRSFGFARALDPDASTT
jgi:Domain of unknown function (DUF5925)/ATPase family associated with various cellular activities (AAA)